MIAKDFLETNLLPIKTNDTGMSASNRLTEYNVPYLPVVKETEEGMFLKGMLSEDDLEGVTLKDEPIDKLNIPLEMNVPFVEESEHLLELMKKVGSSPFKLIPVISEQGNYLGLIDRDNIVQEIAQINLFKDPGGIIVLEMKTVDYSLVEIAQIVESNDAIILGCYVNTFEDSKRLVLTLKLNRLELDTILSTFERYNYDVKASFKEREDGEYLQDRLTSFFNYLNI